MKRKHFILALVAMLSSFSMTTYAQVAKVGNTEYATIDDAIAAWTNNTTLTLLADVTLSDVVTLKSTEHHILNLGTFTMTAASGKNAIEILPMGVGTAAKSCLTINAASVNPGGITTSKSCVSYSKTNGIDDRLMVTINGGVFNGLISSSSNNGGQACPYFVFNGGVFNKSVNLTKAMLKVTGGVFHSMFSCTGDQTAYRLISGGRFKSWLFMTADTNQKFAVGSSKGTYDVGVYVDDEGYLCVGGPVITELSPKYKAKAKSNTKWSSYLKYSSAATYGLYYTSVEKAGTGATVYEHADAAKELDNNAAVKDFTPELPAEVKTFEVEAIDIEATTEATTKVTFNVEPKDASGAKVSNPSAAITFRLPVPAAWAGKANVYHEGTLLDAYTIKEESGAKFVEVSSSSFSEFSVEAIVPLFAGEGTEASPYIIDSSDKLVALSNSVNAGETYAGMYFKLTSDITLSGEWTAIGNGSRSSKSYTGNAFKGVFDGGNNTISGLTITSTTAADAAIGLFGVVDGGTVKNLNLTNVNINVPSSNLAGAAIGMMLNKATADNITVSGAIVGNDGVGGIVGRMIINGTIANCTNNASVTTSYGGIGGIVGKPYYDNASDTSDFATITNCINNGTITAGSYAGGIAGLARANVTGCVNNGEIKGGTQTGGIIGQLIAAGTVSGNENKGKVSGTNHVGGIIGSYTQTSAYSYYNVTIANNINRGEIAATQQCAAILGVNNIDGFTAMTATGNVSHYYVEGLELFGNPEDMVIDATNKFVVPVAQVGENTYSTLAQAISAAQAGETVTLLADLTMSEILVLDKAITLDGNDKTLTSTAGRAINVSGADGVTIKNLTINASGERAINVIQNATNVTIENVTATAANYTVNVAASAPNAVVAINNSTLNGLCTVNVAAAEANVTIDNSTVNCNDNNTTVGEAYAALSLNKDAVGASIVATNSTINVTNGSDSMKGRNAAENGTVSINGSADDVTVMVAVITYEGSANYYSFETLAAAVEYAKAGDVVTLIRDITASDIITINKAITLDGNNKTLTSTAGRAINVSGADGVTIKNLTINASGERAINVIQNATNVTIDGVTATAANYTVNVAASAPNAVVAINNSTLNGLCTVNVAAAGADVTIDNSTVNCNDNNTTVGEAYAALSLNKDAVGASIVATNSTINVTDGSDSKKGRNAAENGTVIINGSTDDVTVMVAVITYEGSAYYYSFATLDDAIEYAKAGDVVTLIRDVTINELVKIEKAITLDLNGKKVTSTAKKAFEVHADATIKNGAIEAAQRCVDTRKAVELTLTDVTLIADEYTTHGNPQPLTIGGSENGTKVVMTNVNISAAAGYGIITFVETELTATNSTIGGYNALYVKPGSDNSTFNFVDSDLSGSTVGNDVEGNSFSTIAVRANNVAVNVDAESTVTANGDHCYAISFISASENTTTGSSVTVAGDITGNILDAPNGNTVKVKAEYADELAAAGYATIEAENGLVAAIKAVAKIGETAYATLAEAVAAAQSGATITLMNGEHELPLFAGKELTFKGESKEGVIVNDAPAAVTQGWLGSTFHFENLTAKGATENYHGLANDVKSVTYKNCNINGLRFLYATEGVSFDGCAFNANGVEHSFWTYGASNVTVKNSTFTYTDRAVNCYSENGAEHEADITFEGCSFTYAGTNDTPEGAVEINSGSAKSFDIAFTGCTAPEKGAMWFNSQWDSKNGENTVVEVDDVIVWQVEKVAKIGETYYATLAEAIAAATPETGWGATVTLLKDITLEGGYADADEGLRIEKSVTINGAGHTIDCGTFKKGIRIYENGEKASNVRFDNITIVNNNAQGRCIDTRSGSINLYMQNTNLTADGVNSQPLTIGGSETMTKVTISGGTIDAGTSGYAVICFVPVTNHINVQGNAVIKGFAAFYLKEGVNNTSIKLSQSTSIGTNKYTAASGVFGTFVIEGSNNTVRLEDNQAVVKAVAGDGAEMAAQAAFLLRGNNNTVGYYNNADAQVVTEGGQAYWTLSDADVTGTKYERNGVEMLLEAETCGYQFITVEDALRYAQDGNTVELLANVDLTSTTKISKAITLDGNNYKLTVSGNGVNALTVSAAKDKTVTFKNLEVACTGYSAGSITAGIYNTGKNNLVLDNVNVLSSNYAIFSSTGNIVVNNSTLKGDMYAIYSSVEADIQLNGSTLEKTKNYGAGSAIYVQKSGSKLNIVNSTITAYAPQANIVAAIEIGDNNVEMNIDEYSTITIEGNNVYVVYVGDKMYNSKKITSGNYNIAAGATINKPNAMLPTIFIKDSKVQLVKDNVAPVMSFTLQDAVNDVEVDQTVQLIDNLELSEFVTVASGKNVTLDLNGKTVNAAWDDETAQKHIYAIDNKGNLVIEGNGTINARGIYNYGELTLNGATINAIDANGGYAVQSKSGAKFTMEAGTIATTYENGDAPGNGYDATTVRVDEGAEFIMNGGEIKNINNYTFAIENRGTTTVKDGKVSSIHSTLANYGTMTIDGGEFTCNGLEGITAHVIWATDGSTTTINGGTFDGKDNYNGFNVDASQGANVVIKGGNFLSVHSGSLYGDGTITVSGGTFFDKIDDARCVLGFQAVANENGTSYTVEYTGHRNAMTFVDGQFTEYVNENDIEVGTLTYTRANIPTTWTPFYVPFEVDVEQLADQGFEVAYINGVRRDDTDYDGELDKFVMEIIYIHSQEEDKVDGSRKTLKANYPYFIRSFGDQRIDLNIVLENAMLYAATNATYDCTTMTEKFEITGVTAKMTATNGDFKENYYGVNSGKWYTFGSNASLNPFRFYMTVTDRENAAKPVEAIEFMSIAIRGEQREDGSTFIYDVEMDAQQPVDYIYDLQGRRVLEPQKGNLYIINGKKVIF